MGHAIFIHGLDNKPEANYLSQLWKRKLAHDDGLDLDTNGITSSMVYWADVLYPSPDTNLAAYERAAGEIETLDGTSVLDLKLGRLKDADAERLRRLARKFEVDPDALNEEQPSEEEIEAVRQERIPVPAWLRKRIMARFVRDAHYYFFNIEYRPRAGASYFVRDELRRRFIDGLRAAETQRPLVVISHSMGTIIAYDCLMHEPSCPPIDGLMTIGSPLGIDEVQDFFPAWSRQSGFPSDRLTGAWVNVFDPLDVVAGLDPYLANDFQRAGRTEIQDVREDNWGTWRHSISKYLQGALLRNHLATMLGVGWR